MTFPQHILVFLACRRDLKPSDPLLEASRLQGSQIAAGVKLQKGGRGLTPKINEGKL